MNAPDFKRIVEVTRPYLIKDSRHTLIIFTTLGLAIMGWAWFNSEYSIEFLGVGGFLLILGVARYFFERSKRPFLVVATIKRKEAIPYARMEGTYDYFIDIVPTANYSFTFDGKVEELSKEPEQRVKVSSDIFKTLGEDDQVMVLFSATKILVGILDAEYKFTSYL